MAATKLRLVAGTERAEPPTRKGRETRETFRNAFRAVIDESGYINARVSDVADKAGKSLGLFYNYYDDKEELLADIAQGFHDELARTTTQPFRAGLSAEAALREAIRIYWDTFKRRKPELVGVFQASMVDPRFAEQWRLIRANAIGRIAVGIRMAQAEGYCPGLDVELAASALVCMADNFCYVWLAGGGDIVKGGFDEERAIDTIWRLWYHSIYWRAGETAPASP